MTAGPGSGDDREPLVLVVDDEENIRFLVESGLQLAGLDTVTAVDGRQALAAVEQHRPGLIVLDVMMPGLDGFDVVKRLRDAGDQTPIIFLTARDATDDRVKGLTSGADDYLVKPFAVAELVARVQLRLMPGDKATRNDSVLQCADLELNDNTHRVTRGGQLIDLSPTEYKLLHVLLANKGRVLTRAQLLDLVWDYDFGGDSSNVDTYISYLRRKLDRGEPKLIHTIRGVGFCIRADR
ncbi:MAG: response regulator transcription factor [Actinomycetia bacterium]|nr:response regulator transcription factor [Actinomycetes bacterium]MCP4228463.1 response regulator transcription factor [Actinomycetes bacterium]MCP5031844.1 response regulator transcription factor [Actinomycetes bacterium]